MSNDITAVLAAIENSSMEIAELSFKLVNPDLMGTTAAAPAAAAPVEKPPAEKPKPAAKPKAAAKLKATPKPEPEEEETDKRDPDEIGESDDDDDDTPAIDVSEVQEVARAVVRAKKPDVLKGLCEEYGVKKISDADPSDFAAILEVLKEAVEG